MGLNSKWTWGLAWTGLAVVLAVPSADFLTGQFGGKANSAAVITSTTDPVTPAAATKPVAEVKAPSVTTTVSKNRVTITPNGTLETVAATPATDPVDKLLKSGKALPDYISDGTTPAKAPALTVTAPAVPDTTQVANVPPAAVAPIPFPARPAVLDKRALPKPALPKTTEPVVIVDEGALPADTPPVQLDTPPDQIATNDGPVPPAAIPDDWRTARERRLQRYLENNGLIDDGAPDGRSSASVTIVDRPSRSYDPDGFYLSDGPNNSRAARRARIEQMLQDEQDDDSGFTLF